METLICITCPKGCILQIETENNQILSITGNSCPRGIKYAENEILHPVRMITSTVKITGASIARCPVMTSLPVSKGKMMDVMREIEKVSISAPVTMNDVIVKNIAGTDADLIVTRTLRKTREI